MSKIENRYEELRLREHVSKPYDYPLVCKELNLILRGLYSKVPKTLQSLLFQDTLAAFQFLPQVQTRSGMEAANQLLQGAEVTFPKHKRAVAVTEFKHAVVACKRRYKAQKDVADSAQLPKDVLVHVFSFLDMHSLVAAAFVSWSWNSAANENTLWQSQYEIFFRKSNSGLKYTEQVGKPAQKTVSLSNKEDRMNLVTVDWREYFKQTYIGNSSLRFTSHRGYCCICKAIVWLNNMRCPKIHGSVKTANEQLKPASVQQIVEYLLEGFFPAPEESTSDTDSDSEEGLLSKLWAYTRH